MARWWSPEQAVVRFKRPSLVRGECHIRVSRPGLAGSDHKARGGGCAVSLLAARKVDQDAEFLLSHTFAPTVIAPRAALVKVGNKANRKQESLIWFGDCGEWVAQRIQTTLAVSVHKCSKSLWLFETGSARRRYTSSQICSACGSGISIPSSIQWMWEDARAGQIWGKTYYH